MPKLKLKPKKAPGGHVNPQPFEPKQTPTKTAGA